MLEQALVFAIAKNGYWIREQGTILSTSLFCDRRDELEHVGEELRREQHHLEKMTAKRKKVPKKQKKGMKMTTKMMLKIKQKKMQRNPHATF